ncbi:MAG: hypothetical protein ACKOCN_09970 [Planctomycetaceae bacterium]
MSAPPTGMILLRCSLAVVAIATIWCGLLPQLLQWAPVSSHVDLMERRGVNPSVMYYTELERLPLRPPWVDQVLILWP